MKTPTTEITPDVREEIIRSLRELGTPANVKGYAYLKSALEILLFSPNAMESITKALYPAIALMHDTTSSRVERAIRHAVEVTYDRNDPDTLSRLLGISDWEKGKLTNSEFLAAVAENIRLKLNRYANSDPSPLPMSMGLTENGVLKLAEEARLTQLRIDLITLGILDPSSIQEANHD